MLIWSVGLLAALLLGLVAAWWLLIKTEGVYLGRRTVIWLYDVYARRYDGIKQYDSDGEEHYLAYPVLRRLGLRAPLVLDVATGTGRLPLALLEHPDFQGRVIGLDLSRRMLAVAAGKLAPHAGRVSLMHAPAEALPFPDNTFDLVTCLEALEFMMDSRAVWRELVRVLRPGGLLVFTNRQGTDAKLMPGKTIAHTALVRWLHDDLGLTRVEIRPWQVDYRLGWAIKPGHSDVTGPRPLEEVWRCPACGTVDLVPVEGGWRCLACEAFVPRGEDGVIELNHKRGAKASRLW